MSLFRGQRGQRRDHYIGDGKYREVAAVAVAHERMNRFDKAAEAWVEAVRFIDWRNKSKSAIQHEYINNRIRFCQNFGKILQKMNNKVAA